MEIHKPHAAKNWREFAVEIGTIVVGILIALGLEQVIESIHDRTVADEAREAVRAEVEENLFWVNNSGKAEPCKLRRLTEIGDILTRAEHGRPFPVAHNIGVLPHGKLTNLRWEANAQAGRASLFSGDEQRYFDNIYYTTDLMLQLWLKEDEVWSQLRALNGQDRLTPDETHDFRKLWAQAKSYDERIQISIARARQWSDEMNLASYNPGNIDNTATDPLRDALCQPITAELKPDLGLGPS